MSVVGGWSQPVDAALYLSEKRWSVTMDQGFRRGFTAAEKTELWDRWQRGESLKAIGRAFGKPSSSIYFQVSPYGGIRPAPRRRSRLALTLSEREEISRGIAVRRSARSYLARSLRTARTFATSPLLLTPCLPGRLRKRDKFKKAIILP